MAECGFVKLRIHAAAPKTPRRMNPYFVRGEIVLYGAKINSWKHQQRSEE